MSKPRIVVVVMVALAALLCQCGKKKADQGSSTAGSMKAGMSMGPAMASDMKTDMRAGPVMRPPGKVTSGPTGITECDKYLEVVCRCTKKSEALKISCKTIKRDAPGWKAKALKNDPQVVADLRKSCVRTLKEVQSAFDCK